MIAREKEKRILGSTKLARLITFFNQFVRVSYASRVMATYNQHNYRRAFNGEPAVLETTAITTDV